MSGAEVGVVVGFISGTITAIDAAKKIYDAVNDAKGLPEDFRAVAQKLPLVNDSLVLIQQKIEETGLDQESCLNMETVIEGCETKAKRLKAIFTRCIPEAKSSTIERYRKAIHAFGNDRKVEVLMKGILEDVQLLAQNSAIKAVPKGSIRKLQLAIDEVSLIKSSVAEDEHGKGPFTNTNYGGKQYNNNNMYGTQTNNNAETIYQGTRKEA
jgi:hypothetical protein